MKIRGKENEAAQSAVQDAVKVQRQQQTESEGVKRNLGRNLGQLALGNVSEDKVSVSLGRAIQEHIDSLEFDGSRRQRVEELKKLVQSGQYKPPTEEVARAVGEDIVFEILTNSNAGEA